MVLRAAIVGCGRIGCGVEGEAADSIYTHAGAYSACAGVDLVAVCDVDALRAESASERWNVPRWFTDPETMLRATVPDLVSVCSPDASHPPILRLALSSRGIRGVVLEKPVALRASDAVDLVTLATASGVPVAVNYTRRYAASHVAVKEAVTGGRLGAIQCVSGYYTKGTFHNGTHWLDLARYFFGEISEVEAFPGSLGPPGDPSFDVRIAFESGLRGSLVACDAASYSLFEMDIVGTKRRIRLLDSGLAVESSEARPSAEFAGYQVLGAATTTRSGFDDPALRVIEDLVRVIESGGRPRCTLEDGARAVVVAEAIVTSALERRRVSVRVPS